MEAAIDMAGIGMPAGSTAKAATMAAQAIPESAFTTITEQIAAPGQRFKLLGSAALVTGTLMAGHAISR